MHVFEAQACGFQKAVGLDASGVTLGSKTRLLRFDARTGRLGLATDRERCLALLAIATRGPIDPKALLHLEAAAA